jgi:outer membrane protease
MYKKNLPISPVSFCLIFFLLLHSKELPAQEHNDPKKISPESLIDTPISKETLNGESVDKQPAKETVINKKNLEISILAGIGIMRGHTTYQIGGNYDSPEGSGEMHFPLSELIFPINTYTALFETNILIFKKLKSGIKFQTNLIEDTDNMKDSDWGVPFEYPADSGTYAWYGPDHLDIFSESKTDLRAYIFEFDILYRFIRYVPKRSYFKEVNLFIGAGYLFQRYEFECRLIRQWDYRPDNPNPQDATGDGNVGLTYDINTHIPYIKLNTELYLKKQYQINFSIGYSPYTIVNDRDNHILRSKISKAECTGSALLFSLSGIINLHTSLFIKLQFNYISIETEGDQKQYTDDEWTATIDQKNFSEKKSAELSIGYSF